MPSTNYAVKVPGLNRVFFLVNFQEPPEALDGWEIEEGAWLEFWPDVFSWPKGSDRPPAPTLGVSRDDPKHYRLFKYPQHLEPAGFAPTGLYDGGVFAPSKWERFARQIPSLVAFETMEDNDPPGAMEEAMRYIREGLRI